MTRIIDKSIFFKSPGILNDKAVIAAAKIVDAK